MDEEEEGDLDDGAYGEVDVEIPPPGDLLGEDTSNQGSECRGESAGA